jgi:hypothetical protein
MEELQMCERCGEYKEDVALHYDPDDFWYNGDDTEHLWCEFCFQEMLDQT